MTTTTSPAMERTQSEKLSKAANDKKKVTERKSINKKVAVSKTIEIKEDQNEDDKLDKKVDVYPQVH